MKATRFTTLFAATAVVALILASATAGAESKTVTISGKLIDLTCAAKGMVKMGSDFNALNNDHKTPKGLKAGCAEMCLKSGQPAGVYNNGKIIATLLANASINLYEWAAKDVEIQGYWAGEKDDKVKTFVPAKIRVKGTEEWTEVQTAQMH